MLDSDAELPEKVADAEQNAIWSKVTELRYLFNQTLLHDAAYRMQVHSRRQVLHQSAVKAIENLYPQELGSHSTDLAYHCEMAGLVEEARAHLIEAAHTAKGVYHNAQAADHLMRALNLTPEEDYQARYEMILDREDLFRLLGKQEEQLQDLEDLNHLLESAREVFTDLELNKSRSKVAIRWANYKTDIGDYAGAIESAKEIISIAEQANIKEDVDDAYYFWSLIIYRQGNYESAYNKGVEGLDHANKIGDLDGESRLLNLLGLIALEQEKFTEARDYFKRSLSVAKDIGNLRDQARSLNNLGNEALTGGNFSAAQTYYERSLELVRKIGDRSREGLVLSNLGYIAGIQGDYSTSKEYNDQSLRYARQAGNRMQEAYALINLSNVHCALEEYPEALSQANRGLSITREIGERNGEAWSLISLGNTYFELRDLDAAKEAFNGAVDLRQSMKQQNLVSEPLAGQARIALEEGDLNKALSYINPIIMYLDQGGTLEGTEEPIRVYLTCYQVLHELDDPRAGLILESGYNLLQTRGGGIKNKVMRNSYYENIPHNKELLFEWKTFQED
jgi:tetratricopeptide (TPR) repeat protein